MAEDRAKRGGGFSRSLDPYEVNIQYNAAAASSQGIQTNTPADWFGPLNPMEPTAPPSVIGRQTDYPSGYNLVQQPKAYDTVSFPTLRGLADGYDLLRLIIETRKDQVARLKWNVVPRDPKKRNEGELGERIKKIEEFFLRPDKQHFWDAWLRMILEDLLVLDAPAVFRRRTNGGELYALDPIDGATIKVVIDDWGRTPAPPTAAYQQVLKGFPAVNYTTNDLIYMPRNVRTWKFYGYSPVEQILMTVNIALRRQVFQLSFFTEGTMPEALIGVPETWTPDQIQQFQTWFDSMLQGNLAERSRARFVPNAVGKTYIPTKDNELFGAAEEWLARVTCFAFSINPQPFVAMMNRATAASAQETAVAEGLAPLQNWIKSFIDTVILEDFKSPDLMFKWEDEDAIAPAERQKILSGYTSDGLLTFNESRIKMGQDPYVGEMFDKPMFKSSMGWVKIEDGPIQTNAATSEGKDSQTGGAVGKPKEGDEAGDPAEDQEAPTAEGDTDPVEKWHKARRLRKSKKYDPDQPRDPGGDGGGQWVSGSGDNEGPDELDDGRKELIGHLKESGMSSREAAQAWGDSLDEDYLMETYDEDFSLEDDIEDLGDSDEAFDAYARSMSDDEVKDALDGFKKVHKAFGRKFDPSKHPRVPKGSENGGQWAETGADNEAAASEPKTDVGGLETAKYQKKIDIAELALARGITAMLAKPEIDKLKTERDEAQRKYNEYVGSLSKMHDDAILPVERVPQRAPKKTDEPLTAAPFAGDDVAEKILNAAAKEVPDWR